jgi:hypothetical protein
MRPANASNRSSRVTTIFNSFRNNNSVAAASARPSATASNASCACWNISVQTPGRRIEKSSQGCGEAARISVMVALLVTGRNFPSFPRVQQVDRGRMPSERPSAAA